MKPSIYKRTVMKPLVELFKQTLLLSDKDNQQHIAVPFTLTSEYEQLRIEFSYSPKFVEETEAIAIIKEAVKKYYPAGDTPEPHHFLPLENLVTISLMHNGNYVGGKHYKACEQVVEISSSQSSRGYLAYPVQSGEWELTIHTHYVGSKEMTIQIHVLGR